MPHPQVERWSVMLLLRGAHATTLGFLAAVNRLLFGAHIPSKKDRRLLQLCAAYLILSYPWYLPVWSLILAVQACRGRVAVADGFLVVLSKSTDNPRPTVPQIVVVGLFGAVGTATILYLLFGVAAPNFDSHAVVVWTALAFTLGPVLANATLRTRRDDLSSLRNAVIVQGLVPTSGAFRTTARTVAPAWIALQHGPVGWVADEGLKTFYEDILSPWNIQGVQANNAAPGFARLLLPARYAFKKP